MKIEAAAKLKDNIDKQLTVKMQKMEVEEQLSAVKLEENNAIIAEVCEELLGSVTHSCNPVLRTSARFIKKKLEDQPRPATPPSVREQQRDARGTQKTAQGRNNKALWTNLERNHFFDALHEFGKDHEAIGNYINSKLKRRSCSDACFKTKDQVRQHYYQTFHKLCKYIKFSDEVKRPVQELYALINYGEMRRKLQFVPDKHLMKLKHLVYQGHTTVRCKGKNIRLKTPSCKALRRINHLDDSLDDIKLPAKIDVIVSPSSMEAFGRVQCVAQNPRVRTTVPLNKKLINFIKTFQYKWRSAEAKLAEEEAKMQAANNAAENAENKEEAGNNNNNNNNLPPPQLKDGEICFTPKPNATLHRPLLSITEYLSSGNICLSAYEERMGVKQRGESLMQEKLAAAAAANAINCKRLRTNSDSDKRSPELKKHKLLPSPTPALNVTPIESKPEHKEEVKEESSGDELGEELKVLLAEPDVMEIESAAATSSKEETADPSAPPHIELPETKPLVSTTTTNSITTTTTTTTTTNSTTTTTTTNSTAGKRSSSAANNSKIVKPLLDEETIRRIHQGWTLSTAGDITVGDLYVVLGSESRLELQYNWKDPSELVPNTNTATASTEKQTGLPYNPQYHDNPEHAKNVTSSNNLSNRLKHLLLIANLSERMRKKTCSCGHVCDRSGNKGRTYISPRVYVQNAQAANGNVHENGVFRQPMVPIRRAICLTQPVKQLNTLQFYKSQKLARQVLVQRMLLPAMGQQTTGQTKDVESVTEAEQNVGVGASMPLLDIEPDIKTNNATATTETTVENETITTTTTTTTASLAENTKDNCTPPLSTNDLVLTVITPETSNDITRTTFSGSLEANRLGEFHYANKDAQCNDLSSFNNRQEETDTSTCNVPDSTIDDNSSSTLSIFNNMMSPMRLIRDSSNSRWLEENFNDFSLTSLLGHLDEIGNRDMMDTSCNISVISESSVDYRHRFQEASAMIQNQDPE